MKKQTIFFSHSSLDKEEVNFIKDKIVKITSNMFNVFVSSDNGQCISYGKGWLGEIEKNLIETSIMFSFITPKSIDNLWIAYEAGFARARGIDVVPICLGIQLSDLKAPLSTLQGFAIDSHYGLNHIIEKINESFDANCKKSFKKSDFDNLVKKGSSRNDLMNSLQKIQTYIKFSDNDDDSLRSLKKLIECGELAIKTKTFFGNKNLDYSFSQCYGEIEFISLGIKIKFLEPKEEYLKHYPGQKRYSAKLDIEISRYQIEQNLNLLNEYYTTVLKLEESRFEIALTEGHKMITEPLNVSALISNNKNFELILNETTTYRFKCLKFSFSKTNIKYNSINKYVDILEVLLSTKHMSFDTFAEFISNLFECGLVLVEEEEASNIKVSIENDNNGIRRRILGN